MHKQMRINTPGEGIEPLLKDNVVYYEINKAAPNGAALAIKIKRGFMNVQML
jgi:hypothetical protein